MGVRGRLLVRTAAPPTIMLAVPSVSPPDRAPRPRIGKTFEMEAFGGVLCERSCSRPSQSGEGKEPQIRFEELLGYGKRSTWIPWPTSGTEYRQRIDNAVDGVGAIGHYTSGTMANRTKLL